MNLDRRLDVTTYACEVFGTTTAEFIGEVTNDHDYDILRYGFCWATSGTPTVDDNIVVVELDEENMFTASVIGLEPNTTYYFRAFAENKKGIGYGAKKSFKTEQQAQGDVPVVETSDCVDYGTNWAYFEGALINDWGMDVYEYGVCWSTSGTPTINDNVLYTSELYYLNYFFVYTEDLNPNTTYKFRAFAVNEYGIGYGDVKTMKTEQQQTEQWYYYDNGINEDAIGTGGGQFWWGVMFPAGSYDGNKVTKVAVYDYRSMDGTLTIFNDGSYSPSNAVATSNVSMYGTEDFIDYTFSSPVTINPNKNLWIVFSNDSGTDYPAAVCANTGDANGRWVSLDNSTWADLALDYGLDYTFMVRAALDNLKGEHWIGCSENAKPIMVATPKMVNNSSNKTFKSYKNK